MLKNIYFTLLLSTALLESSSALMRRNRPLLKQLLLRVDLFPPKLSFPKSVDMFIPGKNWEDLQFFSALFDYCSSDLKSRHILSLKINTQR